MQEIPFTPLNAAENFNPSPSYSSLPPSLKPPLYTIDVLSLDFRVTLLPYLIHTIENQLMKHLQLAWRQKELIQKINIHLYCSQSKRIEMLVIEPEQGPTREFRQLTYPLEKKMAQVKLKSPVKKMELEILRVPG